VREGADFSMLTGFLKTAFGQTRRESAREASARYVVVRLPGRIERRDEDSGSPWFANSSEFRPGITVILDGSDCQYMDSYSIGLLIQQYNDAIRHGRSFVLVLPDGRVRRTLHITRVNTLFPVFGCLSDAIESVSDVGRLPEQQLSAPANLPS
jgi:anti-anti-sigma factor